MDTIIAETLDNLRKNNMNALYVATKAEVAGAVEKLLSPGDTIGVGGSVTLDETGVTALIRRPEYRFIDRYDPSLNAAQKADAFRRALAADVFLLSANAITQGGTLYNVDGNGNRVSALIYGPKKVIVVAGINKIVADVPAAIRRIKTVAAPLNARRLHCKTFCAETGHCLHVDGDMTDGCGSPDRICAQYVASGRQRLAGRITVILVGEACGY